MDAKDREKSEDEGSLHPNRRGRAGTGRSFVWSLCMDTACFPRAFLSNYIYFNTNLMQKGAIMAEKLKIISLGGLNEI